MSPAPEGMAAIALTGGCAAAVIATSVWRRSWPLWLLGYVLLLVAAGLALTFRTRAAAQTTIATPAARFTTWRLAPDPLDGVGSAISTPHVR